MTTLNTLYDDIRNALAYAKGMSKHASAGSSVSAVERRLLDQLKEASAVPGLLSKAKSLAGNPAAKGLMYGAGAMVPVTAGGAYLIHRAGEQAKDNTADIRNKALQTGAGLAAIGGGIYGLHKLLSGGGEKTGADTSAVLADIAAVGYLDTVLQASQPVTKIAECLAINAWHHRHLLETLLA